MKNNKDNLIIWDYPKKKPIKLVFSELILWRDFSKKKNIVSIPILTEKWSDEIRKEYLDCKEMARYLSKCMLLSSCLF